MRATNIKGRFSRRRCLVCVALFVVQTLVSFPPVLARAAQPSPVRCAQDQGTTSRSLLVVLLDRSGSLVAWPGATDPQGYSTSVTRALADMWPGMMAVVTFGNGRTPILGPYLLADPRQRATLKNEIQRYPLGGDTPLAPALLAALALVRHAPGGSRVIIVTDGSPDPQVFAGMNQVDEIEQTLPQFCWLGIPVSTFGLSLDLTRPDGRAANKLLADMAAGTGGEYVNVQNAAHLAQVVMTLFSQWLHLIFVPARFNAGRYTVAVDAYAKRVIFAVFRSKVTSAVVLKGPGARPLPVQVVERSTDRHYEIDSLLVSAVNQPGLYSIDMDGDPGAQVYTFVQTGLHAVLLQPSRGTIAYIGQPLTLEARLLNGTTPIVPRPDEVILTVDVRILVHGRTASRVIIELVQRSNSSLFSRQLTLPGPAGLVRVQVVASYLQIPVEASAAQISIPLQALPAGGPVCGVALPCTWLFSPVTALGGLGVLFLLLGLFLFLLARKPGDWLLIQGSRTQDLGELRRPLWRRIFSRSTLSSQELGCQFYFCGTHFTLLFKRDLYFMIVNDENKVDIQRGIQVFHIKEGDAATELEDGDVLLVEKCVPALFKRKIMQRDHLRKEQERNAQP